MSEENDKICPVCGKPKVWHGLPCMCDCDAKRKEQEQQAELRERELKKIQRYKRESMVPERYLDATFHTFQITENNKKYLKMAKEYVESANNNIINNIGIYIHGPNSTGKTYIMAVICNELLGKGYSCIFTNLAGIMSHTKIYEESEIMDQIRRVDFLFLDDVGKEFMGREFNQANAKYAERILYESINTRYNAQHPSIFSSNYTIQELAEDMSLDIGIIERIEEMSTAVWHLKGDDFRRWKLDQAIEYIPFGKK